MPVVLVLCFVTAVALTLYALVFLRALLVNDKGADLASTAVKGAHTLDRVLFERYEDIRVFATDRTLLEGEDGRDRRKDCGNIKELYGYYSWIGTTDAAGHIMAATEPIGQSMASRSGPPASFETIKTDAARSLGGGQRVR